MYGQTRIFYTMARDGLLPKFFSRVHPKFRTPWINTLVVGLIVAIAAGFFDINFLGDATSVGTLAAFGIVCLTVIWLRRTHPEIPRGYKVPLYPVVPVARHPQLLRADLHGAELRVLVFFGWYVVGAIVLYFVYGMHNSELAKGHPVMADDETAAIPGGCSAGRRRQADHPAVDRRRLTDWKGRSFGAALFLCERASPASALRSASGRAP